MLFFPLSEPFSREQGMGGMSNRPPQENRVNSSVSFLYFLLHVFQVPWDYGFHNGLAACISNEKQLRSIPIPPVVLLGFSFTISNPPAHYLLPVFTCNNLQTGLYCCSLKAALYLLTRLCSCPAPGTFQSDPLPGLAGVLFTTSDFNL